MSAAKSRIAECFSLGLLLGIGSRDDTPPDPKQSAALLRSLYLASKGGTRETREALRTWNITDVELLAFSKGKASSGVVGATWEPEDEHSLRSHGVRSIMDALNNFADRWIVECLSMVEFLDAMNALDSEDGAALTEALTGVRAHLRSIVERCAKIHQDSAGKWTLKPRR